MVVSITGGSFTCGNLEEYRDRLLAIFSYYDGEIWISENGLPEDAPCLGILTGGDMSVISYFAEDGSNYVTLGEKEKDGFCLFCGGQHEVHACQIIDRKMALEGILAFYEKKKLPEVLEWDRVSG